MNSSPQNLTRIIVVIFLVIIVVAFIMNNNTSEDYTVNGELKVNNGNITVTGDGNLTGSVKAEYIALPDYTSKSETYLWADKNTLLWQSGIIGTIPPRESDVMGWTSKLAQTSTVAQIDPSTATTSSIATAYNNLLLNFYARGVIYSNPLPPSKVIRAFDVLTSEHVTVPDVNPGDDVTFNNIRKQMAFGYFIFPEFGVTNINQIQSVQVNFYAEVYRGIEYVPPFNFPQVRDFSDARFGFKNNDSEQIYFDYANQPVPQGRTFDPNPAPLTPIGCNESTGPISTEPNPPIDGSDLYISDLPTLKRWFCNTPNENEVFKFGFDGNWFISTSGAVMKRCRFTRFVINYFASSS